MRISRIEHSIISGFLVFLVLILFSVFTKAQDTVKLSVGFSNTEYYDRFSTEYEQGISAQLDAKIFSKSNFRLGGVFQYNRAKFDTSLDTYQFGPQLSYKFFKGTVEPFGRALFGLQTTYNQDRRFIRTYGVGVDVNLGHIFFTPIIVDNSKTEGIFSKGTNQFAARVGVRF